MSSGLGHRMRRSARWVFFAWLMALLAPLVVPTQPVVQQDSVVLRVCSLMNGVQFIKIPLAEFSDAKIKDHIGQLHASCKCGLNVDHLSIVAADFFLPMSDFHPLEAVAGLRLLKPITLEYAYQSRAPPFMFALS